MFTACHISDVESTWERLRNAATLATARQRGSGGILVVGLAGRPGRLRIDFTAGEVVETTSPRRSDEVELRLVPEVVDLFWLGGLHEPTAFLTGDLQVSGRAQHALRVLAYLDLVSVALAEVTPGVNAPSRFKILRPTELPLAALGAAGLPREIEPQPRDQAALAAYVLSSLHPTCRGLEASHAVCACGDGDVAPEALMVFVETLAELGAIACAADRFVLGSDPGPRALEAVGIAYAQPAIRRERVRLECARFAEGERDTATTAGLVARLSDIAAKALDGGAIRATTPGVPPPTHA